MRTLAHTVYEQCPLHTLNADVFSYVNACCLFFQHSNTLFTRPPYIPSIVAILILVCVRMDICGQSLYHLAHVKKELEHWLAYLARESHLC